MAPESCRPSDASVDRGAAGGGEQEQGGLDALSQHREERRPGEREAARHDNGYRGAPGRPEASHPRARMAPWRAPIPLAAC